MEDLYKWADAFSREHSDKDPKWVRHKIIDKILDKTKIVNKFEGTCYFDDIIEVKILDLGNGHMELYGKAREGTKIGNDYMITITEKN